MDYLIADIYARYRKSQGDNVRLQIGADEHGSKIQHKAEDAGVPVQEFVDQNWASFKQFIDLLNQSYTDIVRTTDPDHMRRCQEIWRKLSDHIYKGTYEGWYCEGCEAFVSQKEYDETGGICPDHQKPYTKLKEDNYYLRISDFKDQIYDAISKDELRIVPEFRKREFLNLLETMPDVSISRPKSQLQWSVEVPDDPDQVMYVWIDALSNYITVLGYPDTNIDQWWPADTQIIGKDILRFHAGIWPTMLFGLGLPLPRTILTHGHITCNSEKMSKSIGNVVAPMEIIDKYGVEAFRYYFARKVSTTDDSDFSWDKMHAAYNELKNDLGNLVQRLAAMCAKYDIAMTEAVSPLEATSGEIDAAMQAYDFSGAFDLVWDQIQNLNKTIDTEKPWALAQTDQAKLAQVLQRLIADLLVITTYLEPFLPDTAAKIRDIFTAQPIAPPATPLFPPIDA
jgi:methionyl-tRNA synthetase